MGIEFMRSNKLTHQGKCILTQFDFLKNETGTYFRALTSSKRGNFTRPINTLILFNQSPKLHQGFLFFSFYHIFSETKHNRTPKKK